MFIYFRVATMSKMIVPKFWFQNLASVRDLRIW